MSDISFEEILRKIRVDYGYTQEEAADGVCSLRNYKRIESGDTIPTAYVLNALSNKFNYDFGALFGVFNTGGNAVFKWKKAISRAIANKDADLMERLINESEQIPESRFVLMTRYYVKGLLLYMNNSSLDEIVECLEKGLRIENNHFKINEIEIKSNEGLSILNAYAVCLGKMGKKADSKAIFEYLINRIRTIIDTSGLFYESSSFISSLYPKCLGGYIDILISEGNIAQGEKEIDSAIAVFAERYDMRYMHLVLWKKVEIQCLSNDYEGAKKTFDHMSFLCEILNNKDFLDRKRIVIERKYPQMMTHKVP